jgi:hypothetical protein
MSSLAALRTTSSVTATAVGERVAITLAASFAGLARRPAARQQCLPQFS